MTFARPSNVSVISPDAQTITSPALSAGRGDAHFGRNGCAWDASGPPVRLRTVGSRRNWSAAWRALSPRPRRAPISHHEKTQREVSMMCVCVSMSVTSTRHRFFSACRFRCGWPCAARTPSFAQVAERGKRDKFPRLCKTAMDCNWRCL